MKFDELSVLIPCHGLDDFPTLLVGADAEGLLAGWSALWHPTLIAAVGKAPSWRPAEFPSDSLTGKLIVVPPVVEKTFTGDLASKADNEGGRVIRGLTQRPEIVAALLEALSDAERDTDSPPANGPALNAELVADFLALGTCYLFSELLVRRMRYVSDLDDGRFRAHLLGAAAAAVAGNETEARQLLGLCCNVLVESRGRYYPVGVSFVDLTLVASTTIGASLRRELAGPQPLNLLCSAEVLAEIAAKEPETMAALRGALEPTPVEQKSSLGEVADGDGATMEQTTTALTPALSQKGRGSIAICGGEWREAELPLLPLESILAGLQRGLAEYQTQLGAQPTVFARRKYGLTPALPPILRSLGFQGAIHCTLDDGRFPQSDSAKTRWEGLDATEIDAIGRVPLEANQAGSFVQLAEKMGHAMDHDHVATICFAHWPGLTSPFYEDLRRIMAIAPIYGKFLTLNEYFANVDSVGLHSRFTPDEYRSPYLQQAITTKQADPLSRWANFYRRYSAANAAQTLDTLSAQLRRSIMPADANIANACSIPITPSEPNAPEVKDEMAQSVARCAAALPRGKDAPAAGYLLFNPLSFGRRVLVQLPELGELPAAKAPIKAVEGTGAGKRAIVDLPSLGFAWIAPTPGEPVRDWSGEPIAQGHALRNEFCEVTIHPTTGGIQSLHDFKTRGNRLSQQLVFRAPGADEANPDAGSRMVADSVEVTDAGLLRGEITSRGKLLDAEGKQLATFLQRFQMTLGSRVATIDIELEPTVALGDDPWNSYFAVRCAWADRAAELRRGVHLGSHITRAKRFEAPEFVDVTAVEGRTTILPGGLPYHCRVGSRMLDTLLATAGETCRKFRFGIGIDVPHPWMAALDLAAPEATLFQTAAPPGPVQYGWFFHLDMKNVAATHWEPILAATPGATEVVGMRCRLLETEGRSGRLRLRCFRSPASAERTNFAGKHLGTLTVEDDQILVDYSGHEWIQVEARWK